ncbi:lysozyme [Cetobacterium ceti]|uniref:Lysozyme n=1 Tax=Cetobacterium ceti TaxID=180163 RepID=A0A1T4QYU9_9FUSO|nr:lysozyme [Cetobacterium ceti]SKA08641.1 lysozyme [Cetobacterium ceti]
MKIGKNGLDLIKQEEGLRLKAYKCQAGVLTIGYGHTRGVKENDVITEEQAEKLLIEDLAESEKWVNKLVKVPLSQNQFDALVSFVFNLGAGALQDSTLLKNLNQGQYYQASQEFKWWRKAGGEVLEILMRRRFRERDLFNSYPNFLKTQLGNWRVEYN